MNKVTSIYHIPDVVWDAWRKQWDNKTGFSMNCGESLYVVQPSNKWDMWVWVRSNANHPGFRGRITIPKELGVDGQYPKFRV